MDNVELENKVYEILERYDNDALVVSDAYGNHGIPDLNSLSKKLDRAVLNQMNPSSDAVFSRYANWVDGVRNNIIKSIELLDRNKDDIDTIRHHLIIAANSLSSFSDIQAYFDPLEMGKKT